MVTMFDIYFATGMGEDGTPRLPASRLSEEERLVEEGKSLTLK